MADLRRLVGWARLALRTVRGVGRWLSVLTWGQVALTGLTPVAQSVAMANMVAAIPGVLRGGMDTPSGDRLVTWAWVYVAVLAATGMIRPLANATGQWVRREVDGRLRRRVMEAMMRPDGVAHLEDESLRPTLDLARGAAPVSGITTGQVANLLPSVVGSRLILIAYLVGMFWVDWRIGLVMLVVTVWNQDQGQKQIWGLSAGQALLPPPPIRYQLDLATTPDPGKEVRVFGLKDWILGRYREQMGDLIQGIWSGRNDFPRNIVAALAGTAVLNVFVLVFLGFAALRGEVSLAELTFTIAALMALNPRGSLNADDLPMAFAADVIGRIEAAEEITAQHASSRGRPPIDAARRTVRFENVSFRYPGTDQDVHRKIGQPSSPRPPKPASPPATASRPDQRRWPLSWPTGRSARNPRPRRRMKSESSAQSKSFEAGRRSRSAPPSSGPSSRRWRWAAATPHRSMRSSMPCGVTSRRRAPDAHWRRRSPDFASRFRGWSRDRRRPAIGSPSMGTNST